MSSTMFLVGWQKSLVTCFINVADKQFEIWQAGSRIKSVPIKGLYGRTVSFEEYVVLMKQEARSEYRRYLQTHPRLTQGRMSGLKRAREHMRRLHHEQAPRDGTAMPSARPHNAEREIFFICSC